MNIINYTSILIGKRELIALGVLVVFFASLMAGQFGVWSFVAVAVLFIGYASWNTTSFLATQSVVRRGNVTACIIPVGIAAAQTLIGLGLAWVIMWLAHHVFHF